MKLVVAVLVGVSIAPAALAEPYPHPPLPSDLPLTEEGVPGRPLADEELYRLLVALSARNDPAAALLAACHAEGAQYGTARWRECITRPRR